MLHMLDGTRYEAVAACPVEGGGNLDTLLREAGVPVAGVPALQARFTSNPMKLARYVGSAAGAVRALRGSIRAAAPDLIHANSVRAGLVATLATAGMRVKILWHVQDDLPRHAISAAIRRLAFRSKRTQLVAVSHATARAFCDDVDFGQRMRVLYNAIDAGRFPRKALPLDDEARAFRDEVGVAQGDFLFVAVGMINPRKQLPALVETFAVVAAREPRAHLAIVGAAMFNDDHLHEQHLRERVVQLGLEGRVHLMGARKEVGAVLRGADVMVMNPAAEPFGLVILESMTSGTPVIATRVGGIPEIIEDGVTGVLVASPLEGNSAELAERMVMAMHEPERMAGMAERADATVLPRFTVEAFGAGLNALYDGIFEGRLNG